MCGLMILCQSARENRKALPNLDAQGHLALPFHSGIVLCSKISCTEYCEGTPGVRAEKKRESRGGCVLGSSHTEAVCQSSQH